MDLPGIAVPTLVTLLVVGLMLGAHFGGRGHGMRPPKHRRPF